MTQTAASAPGFSRWSATTRLLDARDWRHLQTARLAALRDSPDAFVAAPADEEGCGPDDWIASINKSVWAAALKDGHIIGIACLSAPEPSEPPERPFVHSVWVARQYRRRGLVRRMLYELERPARARGSTHLQLWVLENNYEAFDAYLKLDFSPVPERTQNSKKPRGDGTFVQECLMERQLW